MKELIIKSKRARKALMGNILDGDDKREALPSVPSSLISTKSQMSFSGRFTMKHPKTLNTSRCLSENSQLS